MKGESKEATELERVVKRKEAGIRIPLKRAVEAKEATTYFEYVRLIHNALPELNYDEIDTSAIFLNHRFSAPILIDAMTGGTPLALKINENLAAAAEELQLGMGVGSQRAGLKVEALAETYSIARKVAPSIFMAANIGGAQLAKGFSVEDAKRLVEMIRADALAVHLNPLQELVQPEGEPHYKGILARVRELVDRVGVPIIVKEVGAGISREVALKLEMAGVSAINVSGLGGTSWAGVEQIRAEAEDMKDKAELGKLFWDWGLPTAAALIEVRRSIKIPVISSGGIRNGLEIAKSIVLGANLCGMALPLLRQATISKEAVAHFLRKTIMELRTTMYLVGAGNVDALRKVRYILSGPLAEWSRSL